MNLHFEVDQFTSTQSLEEFAARQKAGHDTCRLLELQGRHDEVPAVVFGGMALAMQNIDARSHSSIPFDLDIIVPRNMFERLSETGAFANDPKTRRNRRDGTVLFEKHIILDSVPLPVQVQSGYIGDKENDIAETLYNQGPQTTVMIDGLQVMKAGLVAATKAGTPNNRSRMKDIADLVKAQVVAEYTENEILGDETWRLAVATAIHKASEGLVEQPVWEKAFRIKPILPSWLQQLVSVEFEHPAFANIPRL